MIICKHVSFLFKSSIFVLLVLFSSFCNNTELSSENKININKPQKASFIVLCYHTFLGKPQFGTDFSEDEFIEHLNFFESEGYSFVSYQDIVEGNLQGNKNILLSFDDGNSTNYDIYHSVLKPRGIKSLFAISTAIISKKFYAMTWEQLLELHEDGNEIAAHGFFHLFLYDNNYAKDSKEFKNEIIQSKNMLENKLGIKVRVFVYPYGVYESKALHYIAESGYETAFTVDPGRLDHYENEIFPKVEVLDSEKQFKLSRYIVLRENWDYLQHILTDPDNLKSKPFADFKIKYENFNSEL